jgi:hypothetical protein
MESNPSAWTRQPQRPRGELVVVQAGGAIELCDDRRQLDTDPPLVVAPSGGRESLAPAVPPGRHESGERLDNQDATAVGCTVEQARHDRVSSGGVELVHGERGKNRRRWQAGDGDIATAHPRGEAEFTIGNGRLGQRPRIPIDPDDLRPLVARRRPGCPGGSRSAPEIDERGRWSRPPGQGPDDLPDQQIVKRAVEERERRALAGAVEGRALREPVAALDVRRGQGAKGARDFPKGEIGEVPRLQRANPPVESFVGNELCYILEPPQ